MTNSPEEMDVALENLVKLGIIHKTKEGFVFDPAKVQELVIPGLIPSLPLE